MRLESLKEGAVLALHQIRANKVRAILTILGVIVGVATVMAMSALIVGVRSSVMEGFAAVGPNNFMVARFDLSSAFTFDPGRPPWGDNPRITPEEVREIERLDRVRRTVAGLDLTADLDTGRDRLPNTMVVGRGAGWAVYANTDFIAGNDFLSTDVDAARPVIALSRTLAEGLFGTLDPVGRQVRVDGRPFRVVGVFEPPDNIFTNVVGSFAVVPYTAALKYLDAQPDFLAMFVETAPGVQQEQAIEQVVVAMRTMRKLRPGEPDNFVVIRQQELVRTFDQLTAVFFAVMLALSSAGLLVGGVGVVAIMMIAVTERTREIGIRKAVGATRREILWQFLVEAATLTLVGAAIGMIGGAGIAFLVGAVTPVPAAVPLWAVVAALLTAGVAGILFGLWPAWRAARMDPVAALRYE